MTPADEALCSDVRKRLAICRTVKWGDPDTILVDKEVFDAIPKLLDRIAELGAEVEQLRAALECAEEGIRVSYDTSAAAVAELAQARAAREGMVLVPREPTLASILRAVLAAAEKQS